ncbi:hypothetical protein D9758_007728 [Tetrapyrgos nigripes]|uniref:DUF1772-domain-containing protein n=1 Tax=Tetrapyrgos nigripes TaxID=182062 RepID=A0A8H5G5P4_9AGAR|nr:hypothetical protein D9758_007728 [Tetrapyrgos nigripes]
MSISSHNFGYGTGTRIALALGIAGSAFVSGSLFASSFLTIPALLTPSRSFSPAYLAAQWSRLAGRGRALISPLALIASVAYGFAAYSLHYSYSQSKAKLYLFAGLLTISSWPYANICMRAVHNALEQKARSLASAPLDEGSVRKREIIETERLVQTWAWQNVGRGLLPLVGCALGIVALLF